MAGLNLEEQGAKIYKELQHTQKLEELKIWLNLRTLGVITALVSVVVPLAQATLPTIQREGNLNWCLVNWGLVIITTIPWLIVLLAGVIIYYYANKTYAKKATELYKIRKNLASLYGNNKVEE